MMEDIWPISKSARNSLMPYIEIYEQVLWPIAQRNAAACGRRTSIERFPECYLPEFVAGVRHFVLSHGKVGMHPKLIICGVWACSAELLARLPPRTENTRAADLVKTGCSAELFICDLQDKLVVALQSALDELTSGV